MRQKGSGADGPEPTRDEILAELDWVIERAIEHLGAERAARYLRKFYPWYVERLGIRGAAGRQLLARLQTAPDLQTARSALRA